MLRTRAAPVDYRRIQGSSVDEEHGESARVEPA
jgi:hypothetical protein